MTWADAAGKLAEAADQALAAGDREAFVALIAEASRCLQVARAVETMKMADQSPG